MREIKFRAWGGVPTLKEMRYDILNIGNFNNKYWKIMQWTGLKDKNGKEIYEGDIVEQRFVGDKDSLLIIVKDIRKDYSLLHPGSSKENKVIGNIHENGELLKDG